VLRCPGLRTAVTRVWPSVVHVQRSFSLPLLNNLMNFGFQVRNPAGISNQIPITVQANVPQLFTADGKYLHFVRWKRSETIKQASVQPPLLTRSVSAKTVCKSAVRRIGRRPEIDADMGR